MSNIEDIKIYNDDCLSFLSRIEDNTVNLVLIDPPYEVSKKTNFQSGEKTGKDTDRFRISMDFGDWDKNFDSLNEVIQESYRVLKNSGTIVCFYDLWKISFLKEYLDNAGFNQIRYIEWIKTNPVPINSRINYLTNCREIALTGVKNNKPTFNSSYDNGIYFYPICHDKGRFHPTQKPLELFNNLILKHSQEGDLVLDCFLGSGTTAVSCLLNNRKFIGCEISEEYYEKSLERLNAVRQLTLIKDFLSGGSSEELRQHLLASEYSAATN